MEVSPIPSTASITGAAQKGKLSAVIASFYKYNPQLVTGFPMGAREPQFRKINGYNVMGIFLR